MRARSEAEGPPAVRFPRARRPDDTQGMTVMPAATAEDPVLVASLRCHRLTTSRLRAHVIDWCRQPVTHVYAHGGCVYGVCRDHAGTPHDEDETAAR